MKVTANGLLKKWCVRSKNDYPFFYKYPVYKLKIETVEICNRRILVTGAMELIANKDYEL